jgi:hypothetical protein
MLSEVLRLGEGGEQAADLACGQPDQVLGPVLAIMLLAGPGKLSTGAGAPFERR